ncbi:autotransporter outer membrane beta-barrel domain-containing protein [Kistimonas scapharcae]|uniref:autotransporter outer membrane beta-barrel domain-containing protein n=1 Tax=Kistimonas scapharcae TaxID=1036133 RepID=UPI0031ED7720
MGRHSLAPFFTHVLLFLLSAVAINGHCTAYSSGTYTDSIIAQDAGNTVTLSGNITMNYASGQSGSSALQAENDGRIEGSLESLSIHLLKPDLIGMQAESGGKITLTGPVTIVGQEVGVQGISTWVGAGVDLKGPVSITNNGDYSTAVSAQPGRVTIDGALTIENEGEYAQGLFVKHIGEPGVVTLNGPTNIQASGSDATAIIGWNSIIYIHNALTVSASENAYAIQTLGSSQYVFPPSPLRPVADDPAVAMSMTTRQSFDAQQPNPQVIKIDGKISIQGEYNQLILDLGAGSHINSQLVEATNKGTFRLHFHQPDAKWTTGIGSTIGGGGSLLLDFVNGGIWELPLAAANRMDSGSPVAPLNIARDGSFSIQGHGTLLGHVETLMGEGEQATYLLVKKDITDSPLSLDISNLTAVTDQSNYSLTLRQQSEGSDAYLYGTLSHDLPLPEPDPLPPPLPPPQPVTALPENAALSRLLPVAMIDQSLASRLLTEIPAATDCYYVRNAWQMDNVSGGCPAITNPGFFPWLFPFYEHTRASHLDLDSRDVGYKANLRGLAIGLAQVMDNHRWGIGIFAGNGDIDSRGDIPETRSHADYRGGTLFGSTALNSVLVTARLVFLHSDHNLRQYSDESRLTSDSEIDIWGGQAAWVWSVPLDVWILMPSAGLSYWHTRQRRGRVLEQRTGQVYGNGCSTETYWELPLGLSARGRDFFSTHTSNIAVIPEVGVRFTPSWGDRELPVTVWRNDQPTFKVRQSGARRDKYRTEANVGMQVIGKNMNSAVRYGMSKSRHTFSQQLSGEITWTF